MIMNNLCQGRGECTSAACTQAREEAWPSSLTIREKGQFSKHLCLLGCVNDIVFKRSLRRRSKALQRFCSFLDSEDRHISCESHSLRRQVTLNTHNVSDRRNRHCIQHLGYSRPRQLSKAKEQSQYLWWSCFAVCTKQDWSVSFNTSWAYPTSPLFSRRPWYSSTCVWNLSSLSFLEVSMAFRTDDFLSSRISKSFSKCASASSFALSPLH